MSQPLIDFEQKAPTVGGGSAFAFQASDMEKMEYILKTQADFMFNQFVPIANLVMIALGWFSTAIEVFLRHSFGERYLNLLRVFLAWVVLSIMTTIGTMLAILETDAQATSGLGMYRSVASMGFYQLYYWAFLILAGWHLWRIDQRDRNGEEWYSRSFGISRFNFLIGRKIWKFTVTDWMLFRIVEPIIVILLAILTGLAGAVSVTLWLVISGMTLFIKNNYMYYQSRGVMLDLRDAKIIQEYYRAVLRGENKRHTAGFSIVSLPGGMDRNLDGIPDMFQQPVLNPGHTFHATADTGAGMHNGTPHETV